MKVIKRNKKIRTLNFFGLPVLICMIGIPLSSCYNSNLLNYNPVETPSIKPNDGNSDNKTGSIDSSIVNSKIISNDLVLKQVKANNYDLMQNYNEFANNADFTSYVGNKNLIEDDIIGFLKILYYENDRKISITNANVTDFNISNLNNEGNIVFNQSKISFNLTATISSASVTSDFKLADKIYNLPSNFNSLLKISVKDQVILPTINKYDKRFYLGWKVPIAVVSFDNDIYREVNFNFTQSSFSKAFYVLFELLSDKQSYFDLESEYRSQFQLNASAKNIKILVEKEIDEKSSLYFYCIDIAKNLLDQIIANKPINQIVQSASVYLLDLSFKTGVLPIELKDFLSKALLVNEDGSINPKTMLEVICENKTEIIDLLKLNFGSAFDLLAPLIQDLTPNLTNTNPSYQAIVKIMDRFGISETIKNIITGDVLGVTGKALSLWQIIWHNFNFIINQIKADNTDNTALMSLTGILSMIFSTQDTNGNYPPLIDSLFATDSLKSQFVGFLSNLLPTNAGQYLKILITDNINFNKDAFIKIITSIANVVDGLFSYGTDANSETPYNQRYKNLLFSKVWINEPTIVNNKGLITTSFNYQIKIKILNEVDIDLKVFKDLITDDVFSNVLQTAANISKTDLINQINNAASSNNVSLVTPAETIVANELNRIKFCLVKYIPDTIKLGASDNALTFTYSATNEQVWFNPIKKDNNYYLGLSVGYSLNIFYDDPAMINSIAANYTKANVNYTQTYSVKKTVVITLTFNAIHFQYDVDYNSFWQPLFQNLLLKSYNFESKFNLSDYSTKIANNSTYNPNYYYTNLVFINNSDKLTNDEIKQVIDSNNPQNISEVNSNIALENAVVNQVNWNGSSEIIKGKNIVATQDNKQTLLNQMYTINLKNNNLNSLQYTYDFNFDPIFDFSFGLTFNLKVYTYAKFMGQVVTNNVVKTINLNVNFGTSFYQSSIYFPVNFFDLTNKKLTNSFTRNYFSFKVTPNISIQ